MPTAIVEPTITELLQAFEDGVRTRDRYVDAREGAIYQHWGGAAAILWSRNARRDSDLWKAIYLDSAEAKDLTNLLSDRYDFGRVPDDFGIGTAVLVRPSAAAGAGTLWSGTRIATIGANVESKRYVIKTDKLVAATALTAEVDIRADRTGTGTAIDIGAGAARLDDPLWDTTWTVQRLSCGDGTAFEPAADARARFRDSRKAARPGFLEALIQACVDAGASNAVLFPSDYAGEDSDFGLNMAYVGDAGFSGTIQLCRKIAIALEHTRVLGDELQVRSLVRTNLTVKARVYLWDSPTRVNQEDVLKRLTGALRGYFGSSTDGYSYDRDAMTGAMMKASPEVQFVTIDTPSSNAGVVSTLGGLLNFPATLPRYFLAPNDITISLLPPL